MARGGDATKEMRSPRAKRRSSSCDEIELFVRGLGGCRPINSILICSNGIAAVKFIRSIRTWSYKNFGQERAIAMVAMATPEDLKINAEHLRMADQFIEVPGGMNNNNFKNVPLITQVAKDAGVDAVWPGWGNASEDPELPRSLTANGIIFIGPGPEAMAALGDKIGSTILAQAAGVPTIPWSGSHVSLSFKDCGGVIPDDIYHEACINSADEALEACKKIGFPIMLKASEGGGGKGIRKVNNEDEVRGMFMQVQGEVPGSPIFAMKMASQSRHLEVQLLADVHGNVAALHGRDCSIQRRHQKIIEEGPIVVAPQETIREMEWAARSLAKAVGYVGAATVEYLYSESEKQFYFLELNPRLQVEHPVTEWISGVNIPSAMLMIAMGIPLWCIPDLRRLFDADVKELAPINFDTAISVPPKGHVIAVRITSENPDDGFKPTSGTIDELNFRSTPDVWGYFSVKANGGIHEFSDSQFGHLFAQGENRDGAIHNMVLALKDLTIRGEIMTIVDYCVDLIQCDEYRNGQIHTGWLDSRIARRVKATQIPWHLAVICGSINEAESRATTLMAEYIEFLEKGQIPPAKLSAVAFDIELVLSGVKYYVKMSKRSPGGYTVTVGDVTVLAEVRKLRDGGLLVQIDGQSYAVYAEEEAAGTRLLVDGRTCIFTNEHDPSELRAATAGKLVRRIAEDGTHIGANEAFAEVEVMKMCMPVFTPAAGEIHWRVGEGYAMAAGDLLATMELDDPSAVSRAEPFGGSLPELGLPFVLEQRIDKLFEHALAKVKMILGGYDHDVDEAITSLLSYADDPELPLQQWNAAIATAAARLPRTFLDQQALLVSQYEEDLLENLPAEFPAAKIKAEIESALSSVPSSERSALGLVVAPLLEFTDKFMNGREGFARSLANLIFDEFLRVEAPFGYGPVVEVVDGLRRNGDSLDSLVADVISHQGVEGKVALILRIFDQLVLPNPSPYAAVLRKFSALGGECHSLVTVQAIKLLERTLLSGLRTHVARMLSGLDMFSVESPSAGSIKRKPSPNADEGLYTGLMTQRSSKLKGHAGALVDAPAAVEDALALLLDHTDLTIQEKAIDAYCKRMYFPHMVEKSFEVRRIEPYNNLIAMWSFGNQSECFAGVGVMVVLADLEQWDQVCSSLSDTLKNSSKNGHSVILHVAVMHGREGNFAESMAMRRQSSLDSLSISDAYLRPKKADELELLLGKIISGKSEELCATNVKSVSIICNRGGLVPDRLGYVSDGNGDYSPDAKLRHIDLPLSQQLELAKIEGMNPKYCPSRNRQFHMYLVQQTERPPLRTIFARGVVRKLESSSPQSPSMPLIELEETLKTIISELSRASYTEAASNSSTSVNLSRTSWSHVFLCVLPRIMLLGSFSAEVIAKALKGTAMEVADRLSQDARVAGVYGWEIRLEFVGTGVFRVVVSNHSGHNNIADVYIEKDGMYQPTSATCGNGLGNTPILAPYTMLSPLNRKRLAARRHGTTYVYDWPTIIETCVLSMWENRQKDFHGITGLLEGAPALEVKEFVMSESDQTELEYVDRDAGLNDVGMVAWDILMRTPEIPDGRNIIVVSNDVTYGAGSFSPREGAMFRLAVETAIARKIPVLYIAANSGARIGLAEEVRAAFKIAWVNDADPSQGVSYLYLDDADYEKLHALHSIVAFPLEHANGRRWRITDVIGVEDGLGVECLRSSGSIAGIFSKAYAETVTMTFVSGRTVGIGAYLARLGHRVVQREDQPIILTGYAALNKLLGREVYTSHLQLGGPRVMGHNGVVHSVVPGDMEGIASCLNWLGFVPTAVGAAPPVMASLDGIGRPVEYIPAGTCEARSALAGGTSDEGDFLPGIFDRGSWMELQSGWARTVITGRARLGGIPMGVIAVETNTVMLNLPADPGMPDSREQTLPQAGQVWFPDSAEKTAHAMEEMAREGLPLFILANWRGFSGGQKDLFEGVLQAGSQIVEQLRQYPHPVFVYVPRGGELRGGAWVVVDSQINPEVVEMYADTHAKGGVLEPDGLVEIKFRERELASSMHRLDDKLRELDNVLHSSLKDGTDVGEVKLAIRRREKELLPSYRQAALRFAELHDTPRRMLAKGVIRGVVDWEDSRSFFYWRLRARLEHISFVRMICDGTDMTASEASTTLAGWLEDSGAPSGPDDNKEFVEWLVLHRTSLERRLAELVSDRAVGALFKSGNPKVSLRDSLRRLLADASVNDRDTLMSGIKEALEEVINTSNATPATHK